jgi:hypothetical protein
MPSMLNLSELGTFSRPKLLEALKTYDVNLSKSQSRSRADILSVIQTLPDSLVQTLRNHLIEGAIGNLPTPSAGSKHARSNLDMDSSHLSKRQRHRELAESDVQPSSGLCEDLKFLLLPTEDEVKHCYREFLAATSNDALSLSVCVACARECRTSDGEKLTLASIPNCERLMPKMTHFAHRLTSRMLLVHECLETINGELTGWFCKDCLRALRSNRLPPLALANRMWIGPIPEEVSRLTVPEQILVSLFHPRCYVYKLYPRDTWSHTRDATMLQRGLIGNVTTFEHNLPDIVRMLDGHLMPRPLSILASTIAVTYIGPGKIPKNWLKQTFRVRRAVVYAALHCFKHVTRHPGYQDIDISEDILSTLPVDDVPVEILATMANDPDIEVVQEEADTYLATDSLDRSSERSHQIIRLLLTHLCDSLQ